MGNHFHLNTVIMLLALFACAIVYQIVDGLPPIVRVVGGQYSNINVFSYAAQLRIRCVRNEKERYWGCGSSILNQYMILTAAHCTPGCGVESFMTASVGSNQKRGPNVYRVHSYVPHSNYNANTIANDISIVRLSTELKFSPNVGRVILVPYPPYYKKAYAAGWGYISENPVKSGTLLKSVKQYVIDTSRCKKMHAGMPNGTICASSTNKQEYPSKGDSGAALIIPPNIQIGIESFKNFKKSNRHMIFYSDIGYHYDWIQTTARSLLCTDVDVVCLI